MLIILGKCTPCEAPWIILINTMNGIEYVHWCEVNNNNSGIQNVISDQMTDATNITR